MMYVHIIQTKAQQTQQPQTAIPDEIFIQLFLFYDYYYFVILIPQFFCNSLHALLFHYNYICC